MEQLRSDQSPTSSHRPHVAAKAERSSERWSAAEPLRRLRGLILLGGQLRESRFARAVGRSPFELPVDESRTVLRRWHEELASLARACDTDLPLRLVVDDGRCSPHVVSSLPGSEFLVERERARLRGTAGILRDATEQYEPDDYVLVGNASYVLLQPLTRLASKLAGSKPDVALIAQDDGVPAGLLLLRCKTLQCVPSLGYVDFKEQALPRIAERHVVRVVRRRRRCGAPIRTASDYIHALRRYFQSKHGETESDGPYAEECRRVFSLYEDGSQVGDDTHVHDSVVLRGAVVEPGASLFRSIVCPGAVVRRGQCVVDQLVR